MAEKYVRLLQDARGKRNSGEVCSRNYRKFQGQGCTAPGIRVKSVPVCSDNEQANGLRKERTTMDDAVLLMIL